MWNDKKNVKKLLNVLIVVFTLIVVVLTIQLVRIFLSYLESRREYEDLKQYAVMEDLAVDNSKEIPEESTPEGPEDSNAPSSDVEQPDSEDGEKIMREPTCSLTVDFDSLWEINADVKGWIYLEALDISYPIVQGVDNDEYLYTSVKGTANDGGSIFMDSINADDFSDPHTLIYGHNMKDGSMFGKLKDLYNQETIDDLDTVLCFWIITPGGKYRYDVFSIHTVDASGEAYTVFSGEGEAVGAYMNNMARQTGVKLPQRVYNSKDKVVTLSTCTGSDLYRFIVQGVLHVE